MHSNVKTPVTLHDYKPGAWDLYTWVIDQSKADIFIKPGIIYFCKGTVGMEATKESRKFVNITQTGTCFE